MSKTRSVGTAALFAATLSLGGLGAAAQTWEPVRPGMPFANQAYGYGPAWSGGSYRVMPPLPAYYYPAPMGYRWVLPRRCYANCIAYNDVNFCSVNWASFCPGS